VAGASNKPATSLPFYDSHSMVLSVMESMELQPPASISLANCMQCGARLFPDRSVIVLHRIITCK